MRRRNLSCAAVAAIVAIAVAVVPGVAAHAGSTPTSAAKKAPTVKIALSPAERQFVKKVGAAVIDNQNAISEWRAWVITRPGIANSGYMGTIDDLAHKATTIMWYGPRTPLLTALIREGIRRGIRVSVQQRTYSLRQIDAATAAVFRQAAQGKWAGFKISGVAGLGAADNGITVDGTYTATPAARRGAQVRSLSTVVMGVPVHISPGHAVNLESSRDTDFAPFNAGDLMVEYRQAITLCSSGFAIYLNGRTYTTTAAHCDSNAWVDGNRTVYYGTTPPPTSEWYGNPYITTATANAAIAGALVLGNTGSYLMFNHGYNSTTVATVIGYEDLGLGDLVCTEGGNSGEHCDVAVDNLWYKLQSGLVTIEATTPDHTIASMEGDSGGPVMSLVNTGSGQVRAAGMIQAGNTNDVLGNQYCGEYGAQAVFGVESRCYYDVYFTSMRTVVCSISGAGLYTVNGALPCDYPHD